MSIATELPAPTPAAVRHSEKVAREIRRAIDAAGGRVPFSRYMELALYAPGLGYYAAGATKFGAAGDFVTAPEISRVFPACLARVAADFLTDHPGAGILELGAGSGAMAAGMLTDLAERDRLPSVYQILEVSADLRQRQRDRFEREIPGLASRVEWLDTLPDRPFDAFVLANEVADALPFDRFIVEQGGIDALGVGTRPGGFEWARSTAPDGLRRAVGDIAESAGRDWPPRFIGEVNLALGPWLASVVAALRSGLVLLIDYGLARRELYHPSRAHGTLTCHYRHRAHDDPFLWPGLQDITCWVDFTALADAALDAGLSVEWFTTQAQFLLGAGVAGLAGRERDARARIELAGQLRRLMMPGEMGEAFRVLALGKALVRLPASLGGRDLRRLL